MLQFPGWKIALILGVLLWGALMALPNLFSDTALGIAPVEPATTDQAVLKEWREEVAKAENSKWPKFLPKNKINLGLDLQGGVYLPRTSRAWSLMCAARGNQSRQMIRNNIRPVLQGLASPCFNFPDGKSLLF